MPEYKGTIEVTFTADGATNAEAGVHLPRSPTAPFARVSRASEAPSGESAPFAGKNL